MNREPKCTRCGALAGTNDRPAVKGDPERCYWAAGQRSEAAYDPRKRGWYSAALAQEATTGAAHTSSTASIFQRPERVRRASSCAMPEGLGSEWTDICRGSSSRPWPASAAIARVLSAPPVD